MPFWPYVKPLPGGRFIVLLSGLVLGGGLLGPAVLHAQEPPNPALTFSFSSTFNVNDNQELDTDSLGTSTWIDNAFGLGYLAETKVSRFALDLGTVLRMSDQPDVGSDTDLDNHRLGLSYSRDGANSRLALDARYNRIDVAFFDPLRYASENSNLALDGSDLSTSNDGYRETSSAGVQFETGIDGPLGFNLAASHNSRDYHETTDPDYYDSTTNRVSFGTTLRPNKRVNLRLNASQVKYSDEDVEQTDRTTRRLTAGMDYALSPALRASATLGRTWIDEDETIDGIRVSDDEDGVNGSFSLFRDMVNGRMGLTLSHDVSNDGGDRTNLLFSRDLELPRGSLELAIGPSHQSEGDSGLIGTLLYGQEFYRGRLNATASRRLGSNDDDESVSYTRFGLGWRHGLTALSSLDIGIDYLRVDSEAIGDDRRLTRASIAYSHALAEDWQLSGGYTFTDSDEEDEGSAESNAFFLRLQKAVTFAY
jgi:hypothetical protein